MDRIEKAEGLFKEGYNCAQAVLIAFSDVTGLEKDFAARLSSPFGGGMGRMREVCGAVSGMFMVLGAVEGYDDPADQGAKKQVYATVQKLAAAFREENGSIICSELLGVQKNGDDPSPDFRTKEFYGKRPCVELVKSAAGIVERYLEGNARHAD
mgnify:CR=1 FL=1